VLVICMALRIPEPHLAVWVVTRVAMEDSSESLLTGLVFLIALTAGVALALLLLTFAMDQPWLRFCLMAALVGLGLFLRQAFVIGALGFVIGLISAIIMTAPDFISNPEFVVRACLWLWPVFALGVIAAVAANLLIAPSDPAKLLRAEFLARLRATEDTITQRLSGRSGKMEAARLARAGVPRLLRLLKSAEVAHPSLKSRHAEQSALITLLDRLVASAATIDLLDAREPTAEEQVRLQRIADACVEIRSALADGSPLAPRPRAEPVPGRVGGSAMLPVIADLEHVIDLVHQALGTSAVVLAEGPSEHSSLFLADAFTNPAYVRYALKGMLAVMICYTLQSAVDWPGIRTCLVTCLIVGLGTQGATIQKGTLRIAGALLGGLMGFLAILLLIPSMVSITSLTLLVAAGAAVAGWVVLGSPRIAYAGVQIAFAFFVCVVQGFQPSWHFATIRDRLIGILLGNVVIALVFHYVWPVQAADSMWTHLGSALRAMARLVATETGDVEYAATTESLRLQASQSFTAAQQLADQAAFELGNVSGETVAERERLQRAAADAQSVFLTLLALAHQREGTALPVELALAVRRFDTVAHDTLEAMARSTESRTRPPLEDLHAALAALTSLARDRRARSGSDAVAHLEDRLALCREMMPAMDRLATDLAG
jgi:multidrug resistance protein MdtO